MIDFIDRTSERNGTPINRKYMMGLQGFRALKTTFNGDGSITETNEFGQTNTITLNSDGTITEKFVGEKTITKTTTFNADGSITEALS